MWYLVASSLLPFPEVLLLPVRVRYPSDRKSIFREADAWRTSRSPRRTRTCRKIWPTVLPSALSRGLSTSDLRLETKRSHLRTFWHFFQIRQPSLCFSTNAGEAHRRITEFWHIWFSLGGPPSSAEWSPTRSSRPLGCLGIFEAVCSNTRFALDRTKDGTRRLNRERNKRNNVLREVGRDARRVFRV